MVTRFKQTVLDIRQYSKRNTPIPKILANEMQPEDKKVTEDREKEISKRKLEKVRKLNVNCTLAVSFSLFIDSLV